MENKKNIYIIVFAIALILLIGFLLTGKKETVAPTTEDLSNEETAQENTNNPSSQSPTQSVVKPATVPTAVSVPDDLPPATVRYTTSGFSPTIVTITKGSSVQFTNETNQQMWVASDPHPTHSAIPSFDQQTGVGMGGTYIFKFNETGKWYFHNHLNSSRSGLVIVK